MNDKPDTETACLTEGHSLLLMTALWICWLGSAFAIAASVYVWIFRGQLAITTLAAAIAAFEISLRIYRKKGLIDFDFVNRHVK